MNRLLKRFLRLTADVVLFGGVFLALVMLAAGPIGAFGDHNKFATAGLSITLALYVLFWSLLGGGILRLLLSIDDRLERLEARD